MCTRRDFIDKTVASAAGLAVTPLLYFRPALASGPATPLTPGATGERIAAQSAWTYRVYRAKSANHADVTTWAQIDLGYRQPVEAIRLYPDNRNVSPGDGFPVRFRIECSDDPAFSTAHRMIDWTSSDYPDPNDHIIEFRAKNIAGRYVRLTVTRLRAKKPFTYPPDVQDAPPSESTPAYYLFALAKIGVLSRGVDIAVHRPVSVDAVQGDAEDAAQLTRPARPMGEGIVTDNPQNVTAPASWQPVRYRAQGPLTGVHLAGGLFHTAMAHNIEYLLTSHSVDELLRPFRLRAGKPVPVPTRKPDPFWDETLSGSNAGRFLMGAGTSLRYLEHAELRQRLNAMVQGIADCREPDGYIMGYPQNTFFYDERAAYTRSWLTHGLLEVGYAGNSQAFGLLRGYYDWYNRFPGLAEALRGASEGAQGMVANTRLYFTPVGKPADIQVIQRYFQENYWLKDLTARKPEAVWQYPYDQPECYSLTYLEAYLDIYRATGDKRYLEAVLGGWELYRENWLNTGGSVTLIEFVSCPPKWNSLYERLGETCGSAFWALLNHRLHLLDPENERYMTEIERSFYNVLLANQGGTEGIRYHTMLMGQKEKPTRIGKCCEGQGTRLLGNYPEYIYSISDDGLYVNLFEPSTIEWEHQGRPLKLAMQTDFPKSAAVRLTLHMEGRVGMKLRIRTPSWAQGLMGIEVNGVPVAQGVPGRYATLEREWSPGDVIAFTLPMGFRVTQYEGVDRIPGLERYAFEYGPLLMAALDVPDLELAIVSDEGATGLPGLLKPVAGKALHFTLSHMDGGTTFIPYYEVGEEFFSCFPTVKFVPTKSLSS